MKNFASLKNLFAVELSRNDMKNISGGDIDWEEEDGGSVGCPEVPCPIEPGVREGEYCSVPSGKYGVCGYTYGIWGCVATKKC
jgi:hypothetical protein